MPGYNLSVESKKFTDMTVEGQGDTVSIDGVLELEIANGGILPVLSASLTIQELIFFEDTVALEEKNIGLPFIGPNGTAKGTAEFSFTASGDTAVQGARQICNTGNAEATIDGTVNGLLLVSPIMPLGEFSQIKAGNPDCSIGGGNGEGGLVPPEGGEPPEQQPPDNGDDGDGGGGIIGGGDNGPPPEQGEGSIVVLEEPGRDGQARFRIEGEYDAWFPEFIWDFDDGETETGSREVTHTYDADGTYDVTCTVTDSPTGRTIDEATERVVVSISGTPGQDIGGRDIEGPTNVVVDETNTWTYAPDQDYDPSEYNITWDMNADTNYDGQVYEGSFEVDHAYDFQGPKTIQLTVVQPGFLADDTVVDESYNVDVLDPSTGGLQASLPSMDEAAEAKEREY